MQAEMAKAQEELKSATVEASAGGGMVTVKMSGGLVLRLRSPRPWTPRTSSCSRTRVQAAVNEAIRSAQELAALEDEPRPPAAWATWATWACRGSGRTIDGMSAAWSAGRAPTTVPTRARCT